MARQISGFTTPEAARIARLTVRQVQYWAKTRLVVPSIVDARGKGNHRRYGFRDLLTLRVLAEFRSHGLSLQALRQVQRYLRNRRGQDLKDVQSRLVFAPGHRREVLLAHSAEEIVSLLEKPGQLVAPVVVDLSSIFHDVHASVASLAQERVTRLAKSRPAPQRKRKGRRVAAT